MQILGYLVVDSEGYWPVEFYVNSPIRNFIRLVGMVILGRAKFQKGNFESIAKERVKELQDALENGTIVLAHGSDPGGMRS